MKIRLLFNVAFVAATVSAMPLQVSAQVVVTHNGAPTTGALDLTAAGTTDWVKLGDSSNTGFVAEKNGATNIGSVTGGPASFNTGDWTGFPWSMSWSDGAVPNASGSGVIGSLEAQSPTGDDAALASLSFDVTGIDGTYQLQVYASAFRSAYQLTASLDGGGASNFATGAKGAGGGLLYTVDFTATAGQTLSVLFEQTSDNGGSAFDNIGIGGITLTQVPEPSSFTLLALGMVSLFLVRRRRY